MSCFLKIPPFLAVDLGEDWEVLLTTSSLNLIIQKEATNIYKRQFVNQGT